MMDEGFKNLISKAENGDVEAMAMVGDCYSRGFHTSKDDFKAYTYYKMAADRGHIAATFMVGLNLYMGIGVKKNKSEGIKYIQTAANNGFANAQHLMGKLYQAGEIGFLLKNQNAIKYYKMAAQQGHAEAQFDLGKMYLYDWSQGNNSKRRFDDGLFWLVCASMNTRPEWAQVKAEAIKLVDDNFLHRGYPEQSMVQLINRIRDKYSQYIN